MKVLMVMASIGEGGLEKHTYELARSLAAKNIEVTVLADISHQKKFQGMKFIGIDFSRSRRNPLLLAKIYKTIIEEKPDIIHTQGNKATYLVGILKPFIKAKTVSTLHGKKSSLSMYGKSDFVIIVSNSIGEKLRNVQKETIYNGIQIENVAKIDLYKRFHIPRGKFLIGGVGRLAPVKRFDLLIESIKQDVDLHLLLIGEGVERKNLEKLVRQYNLSDRVTFTGVLDNQEVKKIIKSLDLLCITSEREGFPYVFVEAFLLQTPILSTNVSDIKMFLPQEYIVTQDKHEVAKRIDFIKENYKKVRNDFIQLHQHYAKEFLLETMVDKTVNVYKKVLKGQKK